MYDPPELAPVNDRLWQAIRAHLGDGPARLSRGDDPWAVWMAPDLVLAQTCGMPYRTRLSDHVTLIGTPDYAVQGCPPGWYRSVIVARAEDARSNLTAFEGATLAYNDPLSQSGWAAAMTHFDAAGIRLAQGLCTGAHAHSAAAVATGAADLASLDAVTWRLICRYGDIGPRLKVIDQTAPTPGLPFITAKGRDPEPLFQAIALAIDTLGTDDRASLGLRGLVRLAKSDYMAVPTPAPPPDAWR